LLAGGNGQALAAFGAAALEDLTPLVRAHAHEEPVGLRSAPAVRLERTFHRLKSPVSIPVKMLCNGQKQAGKLEFYRTLIRAVNEAQAESGLFPLVLGCAENRVLQSRPPRDRA
jgi:hypothetical protein